MRKVEYNVFLFSELSDEAKKVAVEDYRNKNIEWLFDDVHAEMLKEWMEEWLEGKNLSGMNVMYSLSHSQGDGVCFRGEVDDEDLDSLVRKFLTEEEGKMLEDYDIELWGEVRRRNSLYYHENTMYFALDSDLYSLELEEELEDSLSLVLSDLGNKIDSYIKELARELEDAGYEEIDYHYTDEYIIQEVEANNTEFYEDGSLH